MAGTEELRNIAEEALGKLGYRLHSLRLSRQKEGMLLKIEIDREEPISLEDIVEASEALGAAFDEKDPIEGAYTLDVSSLGAEKPIPVEELPKKTGAYVLLSLLHPIDGENELEGTLLPSEGEALALEWNRKGRKKRSEIPLSEVREARHAIKF